MRDHRWTVHASVPTSSALAPSRRHGRTAQRWPPPSTPARTAAPAATAMAAPTRMASASLRTAPTWLTGGAVMVAEERNQDGVLVGERPLQCQYCATRATARYG